MTDTPRNSLHNRIRKRRRLPLGDNGTRQLNRVSLFRAAKAQSSPFSVSLLESGSCERVHCEIVISLEHIENHAPQATRSA